jgi:hypothetical protein
MEEDCRLFFVQNSITVVSYYHFIQGIKMRRRKLLILSIILFIIGCGTSEKTEEIDKTRVFDMWRYMTSPLDYKVEYDIYQDGIKVDYYSETHRLLDRGVTYEKVNQDGTVTLYLKNRYILIKESNKESEVNRYVKIGDSNISFSKDINNCRVENYYSQYTLYHATFKSVLTIECLKKSGIKEKLYYGYSEGIVAIIAEENKHFKEYVKVNEERIFKKNDKF